MISPTNTRTYRVRCKSGVTGWRARLRVGYADYAEFLGYSTRFDLASRLGFRSARAAWTANPVIEGSVTPSDFRVVSK